MNGNKHLDKAKKVRFCNEVVTESLFSFLK